MFIVQSYPFPPLSPFVLMQASLNTKVHLVSILTINVEKSFACFDFCKLEVTTRYKKLNFSFRLLQDIRSINRRRKECTLIKQRLSSIVTMKIKRIEMEFFAISWLFLETFIKMTFYGFARVQWRKPIGAFYIPRTGSPIRRHFRRAIT